VNDGICDYELCCDGSEEYAGVGGIKCENRCASIGKEYKRVEEERLKSKQRAAKSRNALIRQAQDSKRQVEATITRLNSEIANLETKAQDLKQKYEEVERSERGKVVSGGGKGGKLGVLVDLSKKRIQELRDSLDKLFDQRDDYKDKVEELEGILKKLKEEYNPNFNDEGVKRAVKSWEDYAAAEAGSENTGLADTDILEIMKEDGELQGINWKEFEGEDAKDTDIRKLLFMPISKTLNNILLVYSIEAYLPASVKDFVHLKFNSLRIWLIENGVIADNAKEGGESKLVKAARESYDAVEADIRHKKTRLAEEEADRDKDYGPDGIFRALKDKCISRDSGEYEYEVCWYGQSTQKSKKGSGNTGLGNFVRIDREIVDEEERHDGKGLGKGVRMVLRYENGQHCWNGPARSTSVWLGCAETEEIWRVSEAEKCVYKMEVGTPAACEDLHEPGVQPGRDEL
jgi:protein kinase C substrate 80K-H